MTKKLPLVTYAGEQIDPNLHYTELLELKHFKDMPLQYKTKAAQIMFEKVRELKKKMNDEFYAKDDPVVDSEYHAMVLFEAVLIHAGAICRDIVEGNR